MQTWIWRSLKLGVPDDWEMLQFTREEAAGNCAFADRYEFRMELNWRRVPGAPDFDRMLADYAHKLAEPEGAAVPERVTHGPWQGVRSLCDGKGASRYGRYFEAVSSLVELVFPWAGEPAREVEATVLDGVALERPDGEGLLRWKAFGMDLRAGGDLELSSCRVQPAFAQMVFSASKRGRRIESFERLGMVEEWMRVPVAEWLKGKGPKDLREARRQTLERHGHRLERVLGVASEQGAAFAGVRPGHYSAAAWTCPEDGRLYLASWFGSRRDAAPELPDGRLACCAAMGAAS